MDNDERDKMERDIQKLKNKQKKEDKKANMTSEEQREYKDEQNRKKEREGNELPVLPQMLVLNLLLV